MISYPARIHLKRVLSDLWCCVIRPAIRCFMHNSLVKIYFFVFSHLFCTKIRKRGRTPKNSKRGILYLSGLNLMEGILTKNNWLRFPPKPKEAKLKIVGGDFTWILTTRSWSNHSLYNICNCAIILTIVLTSEKNQLPWSFVLIYNTRTRL